MGYANNIIPGVEAPTRWLQQECSYFKSLQTGLEKGDDPNKYDDPRGSEMMRGGGALHMYEQV